MGKWPPWHTISLSSVSFLFSQVNTIAKAPPCSRRHWPVAVCPLVPQLPSPLPNNQFYPPNYKLWDKGSINGLITLLLFKVQWANEWQRDNAAHCIIHLDPFTQTHIIRYSFLWQNDTWSVCASTNFARTAGLLDVLRLRSESGFSWFVPIDLRGQSKVLKLMSRQK